MSFEYSIIVQDTNTKIIAYKDGNFFDGKHIKKSETKEWTNKLLQKKETDISEIETLLKLFKVKAIHIKDKNE